MYKKMSTIGLAIATILTTYISAVSLSNQAFAQQDEKGNIGSATQTPIHFLGKILDDPAQRNRLAEQEANFHAGGMHTCRVDKGVCAPYP
jgi:hypothetical protein